MLDVCVSVRAVCLVLEELLKWSPARKRLLDDRIGGNPMINYVE